MHFDGTLVLGNFLVVVSFLSARSISPSLSVFISWCLSYSVAAGDTFSQNCEFLILEGHLVEKMDLQRRSSQAFLPLGWIQQSQPGLEYHTSVFDGQLDVGEDNSGLPSGVIGPKHSLMTHPCVTLVSFVSNPWLWNHSQMTSNDVEWQWFVVPDLGI